MRKLRISELYYSTMDKQKQNKSMDLKTKALEVSMGNFDPINHSQVDVE